MIPAVIALAVAVVGGATAYFWDDIFADPELKKKIKNKRLAVLGSRGVGKTVFFDFLKNQKISNSEFAPTQSKDPVKEAKINIGKDSFNLATCYDISGGNHSAWIKEIEQADYILYLFNVAKVIDKDQEHITTIEKDLISVSEIIKKRYDEGKAKIILVGTHTDEIKSNYKDLASFENKIKTHPIIKSSILRLGGEKRCELVIGSLKDTSEAKNLVEQIFSVI